MDCQPGHHHLAQPGVEEAWEGSHQESSKETLPTCKNKQSPGEGEQSSPGSLQLPHWLCILCSRFCGQHGPVPQGLALGCYGSLGWALMGG